MTISGLVLGAMLFATDAPVPPAPVATPGPLAPSYKPFRTDIAFGWSSFPSLGAGGGNMSVEPKWNFMDQLSAGFRVDFAMNMGGDVGPGDAEISQSILAAGLVKADWYFTTSRVRPWVGLGFGRYSINGQETDSSGTASVKYTGGSFYGFAAQAGLELGAFRMSATYNHLFGATITVVDNFGGDPYTRKYEQHYATVELGFRFGGGRYRR